MKYIKTFEEFANESDQSESVNESRTITNISREIENVAKSMKDTVAKWKKEEDESKKNALKDKLKGFTDHKKKLEKELNDAVAELDKDAELKADEE